jgi:hypothetical protein
MTMTAQQNKRLKCEQLLKQTLNDPKTHLAKVDQKKTYKIWKSNSYHFWLL